MLQMSKHYETEFNSQGSIPQNYSCIRIKEASIHQKNSPNFALAWELRPHSYNNYKTPFEARYGA